jgi:hypothetical protein
MNHEVGVRFEVVVQEGNEAQDRTRHTNSEIQTLSTILVVHDFRPDLDGDKTCIWIRT